MFKPKEKMPTSNAPGGVGNLAKIALNRAIAPEKPSLPSKGMAKFGKK